MPLDLEQKIFRQLFRRLSENLFDGVYFIDRERRITFWNDAAEGITGFSREEVLGSCCRDNILVHVDEEGRSLCPSASCPAHRSMQAKTVIEDSVYLHHKEGHRIPIQTRSIPVESSAKEVIGAIEIFRDRRQAVDQEKLEELQRLSLLDPTTEVGNRRHIEMLLTTRIEELKRFDTPFGLIFCDIDNFKQINDRHGHQRGDAIIKAVARTIVSCVRPFDHVGRWGGDEFLAIISRVQRWQLQAIAERLRALVPQSFITDESGGRITTTISLGATLARPGDDEDSLFQRVDRLLYKSKEGEKNKLMMDDG